MTTMLSLVFLIAGMWIAPLQAQPVLYGLCSAGGTHNHGTLFHFDQTTHAVVTDVNFDDGTNDVVSPNGSLLEVCNGKLYGLSLASSSIPYGYAGTLFDFNPITGAITVDHLFNDYDGNGKAPYGSLIQATNGLLYGFTSQGGTNNSGTMFSFDFTTNTYTVLFNFDNYYNTDNQGMDPVGSLFQASNGKLYGMTEQGGGVDQLEYGGYGSLFEYDIPSGILTKDIGFDINLNGAYPEGSLMQASNGMLYGTTTLGLTYQNTGTVFEFNPITKVLTTVGEFDGESIGYSPHGSLIQANNGKLYGTTEWGGVNNLFFDTLYNANTQSGGVIFDYDPATSIFTVDDGADFIYYKGTTPIADLFQGANGNLYGTCSAGGGLWNDMGTIFEFNIAGDSVHTDYYFGDGTIDGGTPMCTLIPYNNANNVNPDIPTIGADQNPLCSGNTATLSIASGNLNSADHWAWYKDSCNGTLFAVEPLAYVSPTVTTTYYVRGEGECITPGNCASITITVNQLPTPAVSGGPGFCESGLIGTEAYDSYLWNDINGSITQTISVNSTNTYTVTVTDINGCTASASEDIYVGQTPVAYAGGDRMICSNESPINLYDASGTGYFSWSAGGDGFFYPENVLNADYYVGANDILNGTVNLELTAIDPTGLCTAIATDQMTLTIITSPQAYAGGNQSMCSTNLSYTLSNASGTDALLWLTSGDGQFDNPAIANPTYSPGYNDYVSGSVMLSLYSHDSTRHCDSVSDYMTLNIISSPYANAGGDQTMCASDGFFTPFNAMADGPGYIYWSTSGDGYFNGYGVLQQYYPGPEDMQNGSVVLHLTSFGNEQCPIASVDSMTLTIITNYNAYAGGNYQMCSSDISILMNYADYYGVGGTANWTTSGDGVFEDPMDINSVYIPGPNDIAYQLVRLTITTTDNSGECPISSDYAYVLIGEATDAYSGGDQTMCSGDGSILISNAYCVGNAEWVTSGDGYFDLPNNANNVRYYPGPQDISNGNVSLAIYARDPLGICAGTDYSMELTINQTPEFIAFGDEAMCADAGSISLSDIVATGGVYYWFTQGDGYFDNPNFLNPIYFPGVADIGNGSVNLELAANDINNLCTGGIATLTLTIDPPPIAYAGFNDILMCSTEASYLITQSYGSGYINWTTSGDGYFDFPNLTNNLNYFPGPQDILNGFLVLTMTATDPLGQCNDDVSSVDMYIITNIDANAGGDLSECGGTNLQINGSSGTGTIYWLTQGDGFFNDQNILHPYYYPGSNDIYFNGTVLTLTTVNYNQFCPLSVDNMTLTIGTVTSAYAGSDLTMCNSDGYTTINDATANGDVQWFTPGDGRFDNPYGTYTDYYPGPNDALNGGVEIYLFVSDPAGLCSNSSSSLFITIDTNFNAHAGGDLSMCASSPSITITNAFGSGTISWYTYGDGSFDDNTIINPTYTPGPNDILNNGTTLTLKTTNPNLLCPNSIDFINLTIGTATIANAGIDLRMCTSDVAIYITDAGGVGNLLWTTSGSGIFSEPNSDQTVYVPINSDIPNLGVELYLTATDPVGLCPSSIDSMHLSIDTNFNAYAGGTMYMCTTNASVTITNSSGTGTFSWITYGDGTFNDATLLHPTYTPGPFDLQLGSSSLGLYTTNPNLACPNSLDVMYLGIGSPPSAHAGTSQLPCSSIGYITLDQSTATGNEILWSASGDGYFDNSGEIAPNYFYGPTDISTGLVELYLTAYDDIGSCGNITSNIYINIIQSGSITNIPDVTMCADNNSIYLGNAEAEGGNYFWATSGDGSFNNSNLLNPIYYPGSNDFANGSVQLTLYANDPYFECNGQAAAMTLYINQPPSVYAGGTQQMCSFDGSYYLSNSTATQGSISWTTNGDGYFDNPTIINATYYPGASDLLYQYADLNVRVTDNSGSCVAFDYMFLEINPSPVADAGSDQTICTGVGYITLYDASGTGSFTWESSDDGSFINDNLLNPTFYPGPSDISNGSVILFLQATNPASLCATSYSEMLLTIDPTPTVTITANNPTTFCLGGSVTLDAGSFESYLWSDGSTDETLIATTTDNYYVTVTTADGCIGVASSTVLVLPIPSPVITPSGSTVICQGNSVTLDAGNYSGYLWNTGDISQTINVNSSGTFTVTVTNAGGCTGFASQDVTVNPSPSPIITANGSTTFCNGGSVILDAGNFTYYQWSNGSTNETIDATSTDNYSVTVTTANSCSGIASMSVSVFPNPAPIISASGPTTICQGNSVTLDAGNYLDYSWSTTAISQAINVATTGTYSVTVTNGGGCTGTASQIVTVNFTPIPVITAIGVTTFCQGGSVILDAGGVYSSYHWSNGSSIESQVITTSNTYTVTVSAPGGCTGTASQVVTVNQLPVPTITANGPTTFCLGGSVTLSTGIYPAYHWSTGANTQSVVATTSGSYTVVVTDAHGCTGVASQTVTVNGTNANPVMNASGPVQFCQGGNVTLSTSLPYSAYNWSNGAVTPSINVTTSGTYTVTVSNGGNCTGSTHKSITVLVNPQPVITPAGPTVLCSGGSVTLAVGSYYTYHWNTGAISPSILVSTGGIYAVTVSYATGCSASAGTIVEVVSCPTPTALNATNVAATTAMANWVQPSCAYNYTIQISKHNANVWTSYTIIPNSHYTFSALTRSTSYDWMIRTNCNAAQTNVSAWSTIQTFTTLAHRDADESDITSSFNVYPNPANSQATIIFSSDKEDIYDIHLVDMTGRIIQSETYNSIIGENQYQLNLSQVAKGIYMIVLQNKDAILKSKLIVQ